MPRWAWLTIGLVAFAVFAGLFALVGWATLRARKLDDPDHPYLGNP